MRVSLDEWWWILETLGMHLPESIEIADLQKLSREDLAVILAFYILGGCK
jgi:hypothetical protein